MNAPGPSLFELAQMCERTAKEVRELYLLKGDDKGAAEYMEMFREIAGPRAHDTVMKLIEHMTSSPDWRTFS